MAEHPWHPRIVPEFFWLIAMFIINIILQLDSYAPVHAALYALQCVATVYLLFRYRKLLPELNWKFHWIAIPAGVGVLAMWFAVGELVLSIFGGNGEPTPNPITEAKDPTAKLWVQINLGLHLLGMTLIVPMFEELFNRSLLLRSFHRLRNTGIGVIQFLYDLPLMESLLAGKQITQRAMKHDEVFRKEFERTPLGDASVFGMIASSLIFMIAHSPRDWPAAFLCGIAYCLVVKFTNRPGKELGLGPAIWAHAITNALLWGYVVSTDSLWHYL